jgi:acetolactate synthase-1/2/3 large subunit
VDETVTHRPLVGRHLTWTEPQSYFYVNGALGQGLGVALGVKLASPKRPVALLIGDGSFLYNPVIQGLGASRDQSLPLLIVVFNNRKYRAMQDNHTEYYRTASPPRPAFSTALISTAPTILSSAVRLISAAGASARRAN